MENTLRASAGEQADRLLSLTMTEVTGDDDERHHEMPQLLSILKKDSGELIGKSRLLHMTCGLFGCNIWLST